MPQARTFEQLIGIKKEVTYGTPVTVDTAWPLTNAAGTFQQTSTWDEGRRGLASADYDQVPDGAHGEFQVEGFAYPVFLGNLLLGITGSEALSGAADPYTHTFTIGANPPSFTLEETVLAGANGGIQYAGFRPGSLNFTFDAAQGVLGYSCQGMSLAPTKVTPAAVSPLTELRAWSGWRCTVTSTGMTNRVVSGEVNLTRELQVVHTANNTQTPKYILVGPLRVAGSLLLTVEDLTDFDAVLADTRQSLSVKFEYTSGQARSIEFLMTSAVLNAEPLEFDRGGVGVFNRLNWRALHNTTDAGPCQVILINNRATVY